MFDMTGIQNFAKENVGILMSLLDSVWNMVKGNMSVILTVFTELFYIILMSGTAVLNFILSMVRIIFFKEIFYIKKLYSILCVCMCYYIFVSDCFLYHIVLSFKL